MPDPHLLADHAYWQRRLKELVRGAKTPGAVFALQHGDAVVTCAAGTANLATGAPVGTDTLFPIASITKVYTATLALQLVDEGTLDLDLPICTYMPDFKVADERTTRELTARHLLTHTSGLDGDKEDSYGRGDDALERYVAGCADLGQVHELGATFSYCNSGFSILGRLIEVLREKTWDDAIRDHLHAPLGAERSGTLPEDVIWRPLAAPHQTGDDDEPELLGVWELDRSHGPAGGVVTTAGDLLRFVRMHLRGGLAGDGTRVLSAASAAAMRRPALALPDPDSGTTHWGLGWELIRLDGRPDLIGHGGDLLGHHARLVVCPDADLALVLLVNGDGADRIADPLFRAALAEVGAALPEPVAPPAQVPDVDLAAVAGTYETIAVRATLTPAGDRLDARLSVVAERIAELLPESQRERRLVLLPLSPTQFVVRPDEDEPWMSAVFYTSGGERYLHMGLRAMRAR
jgi:CubicO group peptidase (beta-lactamase class C family)